MKALALFHVCFATFLFVLLTQYCSGEGICYDTGTCCAGAPHSDSKGDPFNCTIYYVCLNNTLYAYECSIFGRPYYDVKRMTCDTEANVPECSGGTRPPDEPSPTTTSPTTTITPSPTTTTTTTTTTTSTTTSRPPDGNCTEPGIYLVPYPGNCSLYMICANFQVIPDVVEQCPEGTLFDPTIGQCNLASAVECPPVCPPTGVISLPDEKDCGRYWLCVSGTPSHQSCADGLKFDSVLGQCNVADLVFCPNRCPETGVAYFAHDTDCGKYWLCVNGVPALQSCAPGLVFDPDLGQCVVGDPSNCTSSDDMDNSIALCPKPSSEQEQREWNLWKLWYRTDDTQRTGRTKVRNPASCNEFFICENDRIVNAGACEENKWFFEDNQLIEGECREPDEDEFCTSIANY